ncbi:hypothetical protein [Micromonospora sp. NPDC023814]|uniref:hypothetical protein n=1 Tax=Micromonospora sp. NPDC023814 TaxID=3154596 RepID=UPI0033CFE3EB
MVFSGLLPLLIDDVTDEGERILVRARTPGGPVACPGGPLSSTPTATTCAAAVNKTPPSAPPNF